MAKSLVLTWNAAWSSKKIANWNYLMQVPGPGHHFFLPHPHRNSCNRPGAGAIFPRFLDETEVAWFLSPR